MPSRSFAVHFGIPASLLALSAGVLLSHDPTEAAPAPFKKQPKFITNSIGMKFVRIPAGKFMMGSPKDEAGREDGEGPQHEVEITKPFYLGVYLVTQAEYEKVMGTNPSHFSADGTKKSGKDEVKGLETSTFPVEQVSWHDAVQFCVKLTQREKGWCLICVDRQGKQATRVRTRHGRSGRQPWTGCAGGSCPGRL
jgi:formylglycine-generating enzyme required for sulfatase activity